MAGDFYKLGGISEITSKRRVLHHLLEEITPFYASYGILSAILSCFSSTYFLIYVLDENEAYILLY